MTETDPYGKSSKEPGSKLDAGKSPVWQGLLDYFPRACAAIADLSQAGADKYSWKGWESVPEGINRYRNAGVRHILAEAVEGPFDSELTERGYPILHLTQVVWNHMAALELYLKED